MSATTTRPEALAFVRAAAADPDDRTTLLVAADWYAENGEPLREEHCRVTAALAAPFDSRHCTGISASWCSMCGDCCCPCDEYGDYPSKDYPGCPLHAPLSRHADSKTTLERRLRELEAALTPQWPCKGCKGSGRDDYGRGSGFGPCHVCGGSGDVLKYWLSPIPGDLEPQGKFPLTFACGHLVGVTLPRLADAVDRCGRCGGDGWVYTGLGGGQRSQETCLDCHGNRYRSAPRLRALCQPRDVPLAWVFAGDREPCEIRHGEYRWLDAQDDRNIAAPALIPQPIWRRVPGVFPTAHAAKLALASTLAAFGRTG